MTFYENNYLETMNKVKIERNKNQMIQQKTTMHQQQSFHGKCLKVFFFLPEYIDISLVCGDVLYKAQFDEEKMYI